MKEVFKDPMFWIITLTILAVLGIADYSIYAQCRAVGFGVYYCAMQMK